MRPSSSDTAAMKFSSTAGALRNAFTQARSVISPKPNLLARGGAQVTVNAGGPNPVRVTGSNDQVTVVAAVSAAKSIEAGVALVNPAPVSGFLGTLPAESELEVEATDTHLVITRKNGQPYSFVLMHADYPATQAVRGTRASVDFSNLLDIVDSVKRSVGEDGVVQLASTADKLTLSSTDNFRMTQTVAPNGFGDYTGVLPVAALERLGKVEPQTVTFDGKAINAVGEDVSVTVRALHNHAFPDVGSVLAQKPRSTATAPRLELTAALQRLAAVDSDATVAIAIDQTSMTLSLVGSSTGHGQEDVAVRGGPAAMFTISVNLKFLSDAVRSISGDDVLLGFTAPDSILFLRGADGSLQVTAAVMPVVEGSL